MVSVGHNSPHNMVTLNVISAELNIKFPTLMHPRMFFVLDVTRGERTKFYYSHT